MLFFTDITLFLIFYLQKGLEFILILQILGAYNLLFEDIQENTKIFFRFVHMTLKNFSQTMVESYVLFFFFCNWLASVNTRVNRKYLFIKVTKLYECGYISHFFHFHFSHWAVFFFNNFFSLPQFYAFSVLIVFRFFS